MLSECRQGLRALSARESASAIETFAPAFAPTSASPFPSSLPRLRREHRGRRCLASPAHAGPHAGPHAESPNLGLAYAARRQSPAPVQENRAGLRGRSRRFPAEICRKALAWESRWTAPRLSTLRAGAPQNRDPGCGTPRAPSRPATRDSRGELRRENSRNRRRLRARRHRLN